MTIARNPANVEYEFPEYIAVKIIKKFNKLDNIIKKIKLYSNSKYIIFKLQYELSQNR